MSATPESAPVLSVPRWTDWLSGLQARHPGLFIGLGRLESRMLGERLSAIEIGKPVWVTGLARSGTTLLLELLARHPGFATHRYRDFPPVLTPWIWNRFVDRAASKRAAPVERAHGDGIRVTPESPEAFEEVVWMAFFAELHDPEVSSVLTAQCRHGEFEDFYRDHIRKILLLRGGERYLAKANYNLTRMAYLLELFPEARFVVPFRDPAWHVYSLMNQHERFCAEHRRDPRLERHMSRSGHFEFGADRRPVNRGDTDMNRQIRTLWTEGHDLEAWSLYWKDIHEYLADTLEADPRLRRAVMLVDYDRFCSHPAEVMRAVERHCELSPADIDLARAAADTVRQPSRFRPPLDTDKIVRIRAMTYAVYERLLAAAEQNPSTPAAGAGVS